MIDLKSVIRWTFLCLIFLCASNLLADGKYWPRAAYKKAPDIPGQKVVIIYKDGVEKLIIESSLEGEGKEFGWIIPLPNKPDKFEVASAGFIHTLSTAIQPNVTNDVSQGLRAIIWLAGVITIACLMSIFKRPKKRLHRLLIILFLIFYVAFVFPIMRGRAGVWSDSKGLEGVTIHDEQTVGSYALQTLEAETPDALDKWLGANGFAGLSADEKAVVADYIEEKWYFVASKLRRDDESGYLRPHPLAMSFKTEKPVYPFRLTALTGSDVYLELYVIADELAKCDELTLEVSDKYNYKEDANYYVRDNYEIDILAGFVAKKYAKGIDIGHPQAKDYMWDDCVLSRLCGTIEVGSTDDDLIIDLSASRPYRKHYYSEVGARGKAYLHCILLWCILLPVATAMFGNKQREDSEKKKSILQIFAVAAILLPVTGLVTYFALPKVDVEILGFRGAPSFLVDIYTSRNNAVVFEEHPDLKEMSKDEVVKVLEEYYKSKDSKNMFTGEKVRHEDSPGNYTVLEDERGVVLRRYTKQGYPQDWVVGTEID